MRQCYLIVSTPERSPSRQLVRYFGDSTPIVCRRRDHAGSWVPQVPFERVLGTDRFFVQTGAHGAIADPGRGPRLAAKAGQPPHRQGARTS